jgi:two-component system sensor kinase FixL
LAEVSIEPLAGPNEESDADSRIRMTAMTMMASTMADDLIQPLTAAMNYLHAAAANMKFVDDSAENLELVWLASRQTVRAVEMIERMRSFVAAERVEGRSENLVAMIETVRADLMLDGRFDAELEIAIGRDADFVLVDKIQFELVLSTLLANASEALAGRDVRQVGIEARRKGRDVELSIRDSGPGLSDEAFAGLFVPSFAEAGRPASGLGLTICRAILQSHGGRLLADRPRGGGAAFHLTVPAADRLSQWEELG